MDVVLRAPSWRTSAGAFLAMSEVTRILSAIQKGDSLATEQIFPALYDELKRLAEAKLSHEAPDNSLQPTALVHEAFLRLVDNAQQQHWDSRRHFFAAAAESMRRILVDAARRRNSLKRGGHLQAQPLDLNDAVVEQQQWIEIHEALERLEVADSMAADVVKYRFFAGLSVRETSELLNISPRSVDRIWAFARAWLHREVRDD